MNTCLNIRRTFSLCKAACVVLHFAPEEHQYVSSKTLYDQQMSYRLEEESATSEIDLVFEKHGRGRTRKVIIA